MKNIRTLFCAFLFASLALSSCSNDDIVPADYSGPSEDQASQIALSCTASYAGIDMAWGSSSQVGLYCDELGISNQAISIAAAAAGEVEALFYPKTTWGSGSHTFSIYYPYSSSATSGGKVSGILTDVQQQVGTTSSHISSLGLFYGSTTATEQSGAVSIPLECAVGYITYNLTCSNSDLDDWTVSAITLSNDKGLTMSGAYELDITTGDLDFTSPVDYVQVNISGASKLSTGGLTAYAVVNTGAYKGEELDVVVRLQHDVDWDMVATGKVTLDSDIEAGEMVNIAINLDNYTLDLAPDDSIDLSEDGTANCYIAGVAGQQYRFNATVMGNGAVTPAQVRTDVTSYYGSTDGITPTELAPASVKLLWQTSAALLTDVRLQNGIYIYFTLNGSSNTPLTEGNALIAAYDEAGTIIWSWHIWVTGDEIADHNYSVNSIYDGALTPPVLMDRNIGATSAGIWATTGDNSSIGLYYQFGRKDPFMGPNDASYTTTTFRQAYDADGAAIPAMSISSVFSNAVEWKSISASTIDYADVNKYPMNVAYGSTASFWMTELVDDLWGNTYDTAMGDTDISVGTKTIYDPCPPGYRVPDPYVWTNLTDTPAGGSISSTGMTINCTLSTFTDFKEDGVGGVAFNYDGGAEVAYYPCTGMLYYSACTSFRVGNYAHCLWSNMSTNTDGHARAYFFSYDYSNFYPYKTNYRTWGYPVRCMKE